MDAARSLSLRLSSAFPSEQDQSKDSTRAAEAAIYTVCAVAGVSVVGITHDTVLFQPPGTTLSIPLAEFRDATNAIALIRAKLVEVQR